MQIWLPFPGLNAFFDDEVIDLIASMTNLYALQKSKQLQASREEIKIVLGILIVSGYVPLASRRMYLKN